MCDSKQLVEWPSEIQVAKGHNICGDVLYSVESPSPTDYRPDGYDPPIQTYYTRQAIRSQLLTELAEEFEGQAAITGDKSARAAYTASARLFRRRASKLAAKGES